jgi:hypothetical protein
MPCPSKSPLPDYSNNIWRAVQITKPFIVEFSHPLILEKRVSYHTEQQTEVYMPFRTLQVNFLNHWIYIQCTSKLLSGFPFIDHGNTDNNLESSCVYIHIYIVYICIYIYTVLNVGNWLKYFMQMEKTRRKKYSSFSQSFRYNRTSLSVLINALSYSWSTGFKTLPGD